MKRINFKDIFLGLTVSITFLLTIEVFFSIFLIFYSNSYHPLIKNYLSKKANIPNENIEVKVLKQDKYTNRMIPGDYKINNFKVRINDKGFRGKDFSVANKKGCRIIAFGGSTTLGLQSKKSYPLILEEKLNKNNFNCEVLNFGFGGKSLNFIENLIVNEAINYSPNIITIMSNSNSTRYDSFGNSSISSDIIESRFQLYLYEINKFFYKNIMTYKFMNLASKRFVSWFINKEDKIESPISNNYHLKKYYTEKYVSQLSNIASYTKSRDIKLVLIKEAWFINQDFQNQIKKLSKNQLIDKLMNYKKLDYQNKDELFWMLTNEILNKNLDEVKISNPSVLIVDPLSELYKVKKEINFFKNDGLHLNDNGNRIIANKIFNKIKNEL